MATAKTKELRTPLHVSIPPALYHRLEAFCNERIVSNSWVVERALTRLLDDQEGDTVK